MFRSKLLIKYNMKESREVSKSVLYLGYNYFSSEVLVGKKGYFLLSGDRTSAELHA